MSGATIAIAGFGFLLILILVGVIIAYVIIERRKKDKKKDGTVTPNPNALTIQNTDFKKYLSISRDGIIGNGFGNALQFTEISSNPCAFYQFLHEDFLDIKNALYITIPSIKDAIGSGIAFPASTLILGGDGTKDGNVELFVSDSLEAVREAIRKYPPEDTNFKFSWNYDSTKKLFCLDGSKYCFHAGGFNSVQLRIPDAPPTPRSLMEIIKPVPCTL